MTNPLLEDTRLPRFSAIRPEHVEPAVRELIEANRRELSALLDGGAEGWDGLVVPLERMHHRLSAAWSPVGHLNGVANTDELREAYNACLPLLTAYHTEIAQNERLCAAYQRVLDRDGARLDEAQRTLVEHALRDFRLSGVSLPAESKRRYGEVMEKLATTQAKFDENVMDATSAWSRRVTDAAELDGLPANTVARARAAAEAAGDSGWLLALDPPNYQAVMTHASHEPLRRDFYEAWTTRASDQGPHAGRWDNGPLMAEILALRHEAANLVGYTDYAAYSLATKMARRTSEVLEFLRELATVSRPAAEREFAELEAWAGRPLAAWDVGYYAEKLQQERLQVSEEALRPYFPLPRVMAGLFTVVHRLYGVRIVLRPDADVYHPDVRYYDVLDADGNPRAGFYLDPYARPKKRGGAWMDDCVGRMRMGGSEALPVAYLVCNFTPPVDDRPSLLTHDEVATLFHEFGHGLHHMLTRVDYPSVAGINGVPWDAVELPSQFLENYAWHEGVLEEMAVHHATGEPLPAGKRRQLIATRSFHAGLATMRQVEFALFDFRLHAEYDAAQGGRVLETLEEVRREVAVVPATPWNRFPHSFGHVFAGGYAAGYYSYKWAEVLAADAFAAFEEAGVFDRATAERFLDAILSRGGSRDALEAFVEFRGRKPDIAPLLRQHGIAA